MLPVTSLRRLMVSKITLWNILQQSNLIEDFRIGFPSYELIYCQAISNIHDRFQADVVITDSVTDVEKPSSDFISIWKTFSLRNLYQLLEACDELSTYPRVVTQGFFSTLIANHHHIFNEKVHVQSSQSDVTQFLEFQKAFCSDFFRNLSIRGQLLSLVVLERIFKLESNFFELDLLKDLNVSLFSIEDRYKEKFLEFIFIIHILKNNFNSAAQTFFQSHISGLQNSRYVRSSCLFNSFINYQFRFSVDLRSHSISCLFFRRRINTFCHVRSSRVMTLAWTSMIPMARNSLKFFLTCTRCKPSFV